MAQAFEAMAAMCLEAAQRAGADAADVIVSRDTSLAVTVFDHTLEKAERSENTDIGLRVLVGQKQASIASSDPSPEAMAEVAARAVAMAREAPDDPNVGLAEPDQLADVTSLPDLDLFDQTAEADPAALQEAALAAEAAAEAVSGVSQVQSADASFGEVESFLAASNGFAAPFRRTGWSLSAVAIAGTGAGMERDYDGDYRTHQNDLRTPDEIGLLAGTRAVERLEARKPPTGHYPVLFDERVSSTLIGHLLAAINGSAIARGQSWLLQAEGEQVLPKGVDLVEDPLRLRVGGSRPFDAEGLATTSRKIVADGVLTDPILDLGTARKLGRASTANAARSPGGVPSPRAGNMTLTQGAQTRDDLIADMGTGVLVTSLIGSTINANTGDYSRGAAGFWVENGQIAYPVNECTIAGNLRDMLASFVPANDARSHLSRVVPSLLIEGMTVAGR